MNILAKIDQMVVEFRESMGEKPMLLHLTTDDLKALRETLAGKMELRPLDGQPVEYDGMLIMVSNESYCSVRAPTYDVDQLRSLTSEQNYNERGQWFTNCMYAIAVVLLVLLAHKMENP